MNREMKYTSEQLKEFQSLPLERKVGITCARLTEFYTHFDGKVFISFSGGKDSTVLLHIARKLFPDIPALFLNTGLEYPEIVEFVKTFDNVDIRRPEISFKKVLETEGYPVISKEMSQYIREYRNYLAKQANGAGGGIRKSPITEFEAIRHERGYFKYIEDAIRDLPPHQSKDVNAVMSTTSCYRRKKKTSRTIRLDTTCANIGLSWWTRHLKYPINAA